MACCIITAYVMSHIVKACELFNVEIVKTQYNAFDDGPDRRYEEHGDPRTVAKLRVEGMTCSACTSAIDSVLKALPGVDAVAISLPLATVSVVYDATAVTNTELIAAIETKGYSARVGDLSTHDTLEKIRRTAELAQLREAFNNSGLLAGLTGLAAYAQPYTAAYPGFRTVLDLGVLLASLWVQLIEARWIHTRAWSKGRAANPTMDTLISASLLLGIILHLTKLIILQDSSSASAISSGSFLVVIVTGGRYLDNLMRRQTNDSLAQLYSLQSGTTMVDTYVSPNTDSRQSANSQRLKRSMPAICLEPGNEILIYAGSIVPCDCYISSGTSIIDQAAMTGESLPVTRSVGDFLMSGTRNVSCDLHAIVCKTQENSALSQLVSSATQATEERTSTESGDLLSGSFVHLIFFVAACCASYEYLIRSHLQPSSVRITHSIGRAMAVLSSACPCALGLATPSAIMSGLAFAWSRGIILRSGLPTFEKLANLTYMVMDKTGTLTTGELAVGRSTMPTSTELNKLICIVERQDSLVHPVGRAVFQWAFRQLSENDKAAQAAITSSDLYREVGKGVFCTVQLPGTSEASIVHVGSTIFFQTHDIIIPDERDLSSVMNGTVVHIALNRDHVTTLYLHDTIRPEAYSVLSQLRQSVSLTLLTGDTAMEATRVSHALSIPVLSAHALPHEKAAFVNSLRQTETKLLDADQAAPVIAMLGDGLNDAPAFRSADLGILLSPGLSRSTSAQASVADVIITSSDLGRVTEAIVIAKATVAQIKWNTSWALGYNVLAVGAAAGMLEPWGIKVDAASAGMLMAGSSISVLGWSLWFRRHLRSKILSDT